MRSNPDIAREKVAALRDSLLAPTPEKIVACLPGLVEAASSIGGDDLGSLRALQKELRAVARLIEHGEKLLGLPAAAPETGPALISVEG
jgi:hypothetical protein